MKINVRFFLLFITIYFLSQNILAQGKKYYAKILKNVEVSPIEKVDILNSPFRESNISLSPDGNTIYFESERPVLWTTKDYGTVGRNDPNIWFSRRINGNWQNPEPLENFVNTPLGEGEPNFSSDGKFIYFQSWKNDWDISGGPYYMAELRDGKWLNPIGMNSNITQFFTSAFLKSHLTSTPGTDGSTISPDGKKMVVAFGGDYYGNMDLYISIKNFRGEWSKFNRLPISTTYDDRTPFIAFDGKTLFFCSDGYDGNGGLDIYKTTVNDDGSVGEVFNLGEPFNSKDDDYGFVVTADGKEAYFIRNGDIYRADLKNIIFELPVVPTLKPITQKIEKINIDTMVEVKQLNLLSLKGTIIDSLTHQPIEASISIRPIDASLSIVNVDDNKQVTVANSDPATGKYSAALTRDINYLLWISKKGYNSISKSLKIERDDTTSVINFHVELAPIISNQEDTARQCVSRFYDTKFSFGVIPAYPYALGLKTELNYRDFGAFIIGMYLPNVGIYDNPKPPDDFLKDNYQTMFMLALNYNFPLSSCNFYPFVGVFGGIRTRYWKKDMPPGSTNIMSDNFTDYPIGAVIGAKYFIYNNFYIDLGVGIGRFAFHIYPSGDITSYGLKYVPWLSICYKLD